jgi:dipeptide/tripeptide permease
MEVLQIAAFGLWIAGLAVTAGALTVRLRAIRDVRRRLRALGFAYLGFLVVVAGAVPYTLFLIVEERLSLWAGVFALALVGYSAALLWFAAVRRFAEARRTASSDLPERRASPDSPMGR